MFTSRLNYGAAFLACVGLVVAALYLQHVKGIEPCPLCMLQRWAIMVIAALCLLAAIHAPIALARRVYGSLVAVVALLGGAIAIRHLWLQSLPAEQAPACGPGLEYMLEHLPLDRAMKAILLGSGECAEVLWTFLGLSLPAWTLLAFVALFAFGLIQAWRSQGI